MKTSAFFVSRNDEDNRDSLLFRLRWSCESLLACCDEVIVVDWNSPSPLSPVLASLVPATGRLRVIEVQPPHTSATKCRVGCIFGDNIAIRRATGDILIATTQDAVAPPREVFEQAGVRSDTFYAVARRNVQPIHSFKMLPDLHRYLLSKNFPQDAIWTEARPSYLQGDVYSLVDNCGDFQVGHRDIWLKAKGYEEGMDGMENPDSNMLLKAKKVCGYNIAVLDIPVWHWHHERRGGTGPRNSRWQEWGVNFTASRNSDDWGMPGVDFKETRI